MQKILICLAILAVPVSASAQEAGYATLTFNRDGTVSLTCAEAPGGFAANPAATWVLVGIALAEFLATHGPTIVDLVGSYPPPPH